MPTLELMVEGMRRQAASFGLSLQPGANEEQLDTLRIRVRHKLNADLPARHLELLRIVNGMNENSLYVYATNLSHDVGSKGGIIIGFVEQNERLRDDDERLADMLVFSSNDQYFHTQDLKSRKYLLLPQDGSPPDAVFDTYDELMQYALNRALRPQFRL